MKAKPKIKRIDNGEVTWFFFNVNGLQIKESFDSLVENSKFEGTDYQ